MTTGVVLVWKEHLFWERKGGRAWRGRGAEETSEDSRKSPSNQVALVLFLAVFAVPSCWFSGLADLFLLGLEDGLYLLLSSVYFLFSCQLLFMDLRT
jgi:purine-cytosine permease-like protein